MTDTTSARAEVAPQLIYYYFGSKRRLHLAVCEQNAIDAINDIISQDFNGAFAKPALERMLDRMFHRVMQAVSDKIAFYEIDAQHAITPTAKLMLRARLPAVVNKMGAILRAGGKTGAFQRDVDAGMYFGTALSLMYGYLANEAIMSAVMKEDIHAPAARTRWTSHIRSLMLASIEPSASPHPYCAVAQADDSATRTPSQSYDADEVAVPCGMIVHPKNSDR